MLDTEPPQLHPKPQSRLKRGLAIAGVVALLMVAVAVAVIASPYANRRATPRDVNYRFHADDAWNGGYTNLHRAAESGELAEVERLLRAGADPDIRTNQGQSSVHWLVSADQVATHMACLEALLAAGGDAGVADRDGLTPLHLVARFGTAAQAELLIARGADPNARAEHGFTPLHEAAGSMTPEHRLEVVRVLLRAGADPAIVDVNGDTAAAHARRGGREGLARLLD